MLFGISKSENIWFERNLFGIWYRRSSKVIEHWFISLYPENCTLSQLSRVQSHLWKTLFKGHRYVIPHKLLPVPRCAAPLTRCSHPMRKSGGRGLARAGTQMLRFIYLDWCRVNCFKPHIALNRTLFRLLVGGC